MQPVNNGQPQRVPPMPVPTNINMQSVEASNGDRFLVLEVNTWTHDASYFIPAEFVGAFVKMATEVGREVAVGLDLPRSGIIKP